MTTKIFSILSTFVIFVMVIQTRADDVKSVKYTPNRETITKMDKNKGVLQKRIEPGKTPVKSLKKLIVGFQFAILYDYEAILDSNKLNVNFLKTLEEEKKLQLTDFLHKVIYSYEFFRDTWKGRYLSSRKINESKSSSSDFGQSISKPYPIGDKYFGEGNILSTFKLLQSKREEAFREIFMGFRLSFDPKTTHMLVEMNISPSSEKGPGVIIPF
jgi:hypothetical protein